MRALLTTTRNWHLGHTALAFFRRGALAALCMADKEALGLPPALYRRCWPFHLAMKPFYHLAPQVCEERAGYFFAPLYDWWIRSQLRSPSAPSFDIAHAIVGLGAEPFAAAERCGALKVIDCPNSHPTTLHGFWQREFDLWCPGDRIPIPTRMFARMNRDLERADLIIVQSRFCKESMVLNGIPEEKVLINPMGVDTSIFRKRQQPPATPRFACVATISLRKGHQYLFRAFEIVKKRLPNAELVCAGPYKHDFRFEKPKWIGTFTHCPALSHPQVANLLQNSTAFVFPSQEEGIARAQVEALASGLPVIGTHYGGASTLVDDGVEGFIVRGRDPQHIADAMIKLALDADLNQRMGDAAFRKGSLRNTWQDYGDRLLAEYQRRLSPAKAL